MATGTSPRIRITGEDFTTVMKMELSPVTGDGVIVDPPVPTEDGMPSQAMYDYQNKYKDFSFEKICVPDYGPDDSLPRLTGMPANDPDYIADFHFIALMRIIDHILQHRYVGYIGGDYSTPKPR